MCCGGARARRFRLSAQGATEFTLTGHGWGHGIGMSQYGALGYAQHGWGYAQILDHYFTGTHVAPLPRSVHRAGAAVVGLVRALRRLVGDDAAGTPPATRKR